MLAHTSHAANPPKIAVIVGGAPRTFVWPKVHMPLARAVELLGAGSHAFVVLKPETQLSAVDVTNFVAGRVAAYKHVRNVTFVEEIPKSASGKILRRVLRDRLKEGSSP